MVISGKWVRPEVLNTTKSSRATIAKVKKKYKKDKQGFAGNGIRGFHPLPVQTLFVWHNCKITQCFLLCLLLCKSGLLYFYECYHKAGLAPDSARLAVVFCAEEYHPPV